MSIKNKVLTVIFTSILLAALFALFSHSNARSNSNVLNFRALRSAAFKGDTQALSTLKVLAERGDVNAQYHLGLFYYGKKGMLKEASIWFIKAAEQGNKDSLSYLFYIVEKNDDAEAMKCIIKHANKDRPSTQRSLGNVYARKKSVFYNQQEAEKWFNKVIEAAKSGNSEAQLQLGSMYSYGDGVKKDYEEALKWYTKAAENDNVNALFS